MANEGMPCGLRDIPLEVSPLSSLSFASHNLHVLHPLHYVSAQPCCTMVGNFTDDGAHGLAIVWLLCFSSILMAFSFLTFPYDLDFGLCFWLLTDPCH